LLNRSGEVEQEWRMDNQRPPGWRAAQREARRLMAARLFHAGELDQAEIARTGGCVAASSWSACT